MSFTRTLYDKSALLQRDSTSKSIFDNITSDSSVKESNKSCFLRASPFSHFPQNSIPSAIIDLDSELRNQTRIAGDRLIPDKPICPDCKNCSSSLPCDCLHCLTSAEHTNGIECKDDIDLIPIYSRIEKPCNIFQGITINRFPVLCSNPQDEYKIPTNDIVGINSRLAVKDSYDSRNRI